MQELNYSRKSSVLPAPVNHQHNRHCMSAATKLWKYLRRMLKFDQMDFEFAFWQVVYLFIAPQKVYRNFQYRKQSKAQFARDDPAFLVLLMLCLFITSVAFAKVLYLTFGQFVYFLLYAVFIDCIGSGIVISTVFWCVLNKYFRVNKDQDVEWGFAFDVHLNAFFPPLIILHFCQLFLNTGLIKHSDGWFILTLIGNTFWLTAIIYYVYITFLGYHSLQMLQNTHLLLTPIPVIILLYVASLVMEYSITYSLLRFYKERTW